jgi:ABC-2 type transport system ATP-binding protein
MTAEPVITVNSLTRSFGGQVALDGLDLDVHRGEVLALLGPNGAGKTTTVRLLNGVLSPDSGSASVFGLNPATDGDAVRRRTGVLTENAGLDDRLTARENLVYTARMRGYSKAEACDRVHAQLDRFGMHDQADQRTIGYSTGQRKRVALARALLHDPDILFLDEPTSGLDPSATRDVTDLIGSLASEHGRTVVLATHFLGEAGRIADRMAVLDHGRLRASGRPDELAAELWGAGIPADIDLGQPPTPLVVALVERLDGVLHVSTRAAGVTVGVRDRAAMATVLRELAANEIDVFGANLRRASMEDVYFALEESFTTKSVS